MTRAARLPTLALAGRAQRAGRKGADVRAAAGRARERNGGSRRPAALALLAAIALVSGCETCRTPPLRNGYDAPALPAETVPIATVLNEIRCDYLDFAYSDYARQRLLAVGRVVGTLRLSVSHDGTRLGSFAVPVTAGTLPFGRGGDAAVAQSVLTVPFALDPKLALDPAGAGFDCSAGARLEHPIWDVTALAAAVAPVQAAAPQLTLRSPLTFQGRFYLRRGDTGVEPVAVTVDPARSGAAALYLQSFEATVETGVASWFADVGAATAEPKGLPGTGYAAAPPPRASRVRVPTAPHPARTGPPRTMLVHRCTPDASGELLCY